MKVYSDGTIVVLFDIIFYLFVCFNPGWILQTYQKAIIYSFFFVPVPQEMEVYSDTGEGLVAMEDGSEGGLVAMEGENGQYVVLEVIQLGEGQQLQTELLHGERFLLIFCVFFFFQL